MPHAAPPSWSSGAPWQTRPRAVSRPPRRGIMMWPRGGEDGRAPLLAAWRNNNRAERVCADLDLAGVVVCTGGTADAGVALSGAAAADARQAGALRVRDHTGDAGAPAFPRQVLSDG